MRSFAILAAVALLAACEAAPLADYDPHQRFRPTVEKRQAVAALSPWRDGAPLSPADRAVIADLVREHLRRGAGPVAVAAAGPSDEAARTFAGVVTEALDEAGADAVAVTFATAPAVAAEIRVPIWVAVVPECGAWPEAVNPDRRNQNTANFGCAIARNIGLMVSDPADLERARGATGRSGVRSADVLTKYGEGKATASKAEEAKPSATLSTVGSK
ncbi:CpaD family pilus assembly lipoprotein [Magnetospirillum sp. UT-4]|uniref:CpaD family pilus assembly lipoprotein n=1 Tax=Magnetospirillum sp. UT-4 TaxID=2681467 RepID=UPI0013817FC3|nr:CpaD family pilus assembly lipoprotein [Magnetospirillum sp. UT-4]CAA7625886.1 putative pilus assembly protein cpaD [Magnetospirillum sp. UT-4]